MEFIALRKQITKDFILSKLNQETIMKYYTNMDVNSKKLFTSIFRVDNHITCSFYKSKSGILYLHDFATNEHINCFQVVMKLYGCNYYEALKIVARDFGLIDNELNIQRKEIEFVPEIKKSETCKIQCQIKKFSEEELAWWRQFGISYNLLKKYHVYSIQNAFLNGELKFTSENKNPIFGYYFGKDKNGNEKWKLYFPNKTNYRFIGNLTQKILQGYKQLPESGDLLIINKSMKDTMCCSKLGFASVSPNSETTFPSDKQLEEFKKRFKHILIVFDNDRPGKHNLWKVRKQYPEFNYFFIPNSLGAKDLTDLVKLKGIDEVKDLINKFISNYKFK